MTCLRKPSLTAAQIREARKLLGWRQQDLAKWAGVPFSTLCQFERGRHEKPHNRTLAYLRGALEDAGIEFVQDGNGSAGVRLRELPGVVNKIGAPPPQAVPVHSVTSAVGTAAAPPVETRLQPGKLADR
jgi:transcriptional regulator with XRE-family HTH domain